MFIAAAGLWYREVQRGWTEEAILRAKREWENTFDVIPDLIAMIDTEHRIFRVNRAMSEKMGHKPQDILGRKCYEIFHWTSAPLAVCPHTLMLQDGKEHTLEKVIEPFFTTKPLNAGTGLGLSITHGIIIDHSGKIDIESREGRSTRVVLYLPAYEEEHGLTYFGRR